MEERQFEIVFLEDILHITLSELQKSFFRENQSTGEGSAVLPCF